MAASMRATNLVKGATCPALRSAPRVGASRRGVPLRKSVGHGPSCGCNRCATSKSLHGAGCGCSSCISRSSAHVSGCSCASCLSEAEVHAHGCGCSSCAPAKAVHGVGCSCRSCSGSGAKAGAAFAASALALTVGLGSVEPASADVSGLTPCSESKAFQKVQKKELKTLERRLKKYEPGSAPALALEATKDRTQKRFATYAKQGLLCGNDGLPHLISDPGLALRYNHAGETFIPTFGFLYVAGYIGYVGRQYIIAAKESGKAYDREIIIDVPLALKLAFQGWTWPLATVQELRSGKLLEKEENITVSPR